MTRIAYAAIAAVVALAVPVTSHAGIIASLGADPTSATGSFSNSLGTSVSPFDDQYTFSLDHPLTLTIASTTNVFPSPSDFISGFTAGVFAGTPATPGAEVLGPDHAVQGCGPIALCQHIAGSAILGPGLYFLDISGTPHGSSGYGGNLATSAVPLPATLPLAALGLFFAGFIARRKPRITVG